MAAQSPAAHMAGVGGGGCAIGGLVTLAKIVILTTVARFSYNEWNSSGCSLEVRLLIISSSKHVDIRYIYIKLSLTHQITFQHATCVHVIAKPWVPTSPFCSLESVWTVISKGVTEEVMPVAGAVG